MNLRICGMLEEKEIFLTDNDEMSLRILKDGWNNPHKNSRKHET